MKCPEGTPGYPPAEKAIAGVGFDSGRVKSVLRGCTEEAPQTAQVSRHFFATTVAVGLLANH